MNEEAIKIVEKMQRDVELWYMRQQDVLSSLIGKLKEYPGVKEELELRGRGIPDKEHTGETPDNEWQK